MVNEVRILQAEFTQETGDIFYLFENEAQK